LILFGRERQTTLFVTVLDTQAVSQESLGHPHNESILSFLLVRIRQGGISRALSRARTGRCDQSYLLQSQPVLGAEKAVEVNYLFQVTHRLVLQPAVQYFAEVGANPRQGDAIAAGFRLKLTF
jgi:hypothetical protein